MAKFTMSHSCKYFFGQKVLESENAEKAKELCEKECERIHHERYDGDSKVRRDCSAKCGLKIKVFHTRK